MISDYTSKLLTIGLTCFLLQACQNSAIDKVDSSSDSKTEKADSNEKQVEETQPEGMVWIPAGTYTIGSEDEHAKLVEGPAYEVQVDGFWMDETEVTNAEFRKFVKATGYKTVAERPVDWEGLKQMLPPGTPKPHDSILEPGSMVFQPKPAANLYDITQWWAWVNGADWQHPYGPESNIEGKDNHPVVHIAYEDAVAYADWAGKKLPTEAQWEVAARGGDGHQSFAWGDKLTPEGKYLANFYQGQFPDGNSAKDGFAKTAPVKSYEPNGFGLYDMIGNVWEWTSDWYRPDTHAQNKKQAGIRGCINPNGPSRSYDPQEPLTPKRVTKGGSYLCSDEYCSNYRPSARMATAYDSGQEHLGFRCVKQ